MKIKFNENFKPINEKGELIDNLFDKRFKIDRTYNYNAKYSKYRIRFVQYPNEKLITVNLVRLFKPMTFIIKLREKYMHNGLLNNFFGFFERFYYKSQYFNMNENEILMKFNYKI